MGTFIEPFDFKTLFINYFLGKGELFAFAFVIILSYVAAKLQMSNLIFGMVLVIGSIMFAAFLGQAIYFLILVMTGFILIAVMHKIFT